jgi:hypothetical protein
MNEDTQKYVRTAWGIDSYESCAYLLRAVESGAATKDERKRLWAIVKVLFHKEGSLPPSQWVEE